MLVAQWADKLYWIVLVAQLPSTIFHNYPTLLLVPLLEFQPIVSKLMLPMLLPERPGSSFWEEKEDLQKNKIQFEICLLNSLKKIKSGIKSYFFPPSLILLDSDFVQDSLQLQLNNMKFQQQSQSVLYLLSLKIKCTG